MNYLVDGYNLIGTMTSICLSDADKELKLRQFIKQYYSPFNYYYLIFDGNRDTITVEQYTYTTVIFTTEDQSADCYMAAFVQQKSGCTSVTNDRYLQKRVRRHCRQILSADAFLRLRQRRREAVSSPVQPYSSEIRWLLGQFQA